MQRQHLIIAVVAVALTGCNLDFAPERLTPAADTLTATDSGAGDTATSADTRDDAAAGDVPEVTDIPDTALSHDTATTDTADAPDLGPCGSGRVDCDGVCVDTASNPSHCGACGQACGDGLSCCAGGCLPPEDTACAWSATEYRFRRYLDIRSGAEPLPAGYALSVALPHDAWVEQGKSEASGDDVRIGLLSESLSFQLRLLDPTSAWQQPDTTVWFRLTGPLPANHQPTYPRYVYYGAPNSGPALTPSLTDIFSVGTTFDDPTLSGFDGLTTGAGSVAVDVGELAVRSTAAADAAIARRLSPLPADRKVAVRVLARTDGFNQSTNAHVLGVQVGAAPEIGTYGTATVGNVVVLQTGSNLSILVRGGALTEPFYWDDNARQWGTTRVSLPTSLWSQHEDVELLSDGQQFRIRIRDGSGGGLVTTTGVQWSNIAAENDSLWVYCGDPYDNTSEVDMRVDLYTERPYVYPEPTVVLGPEEQLGP